VIEEQTPARTFTFVIDLIAYLQQNDLEIVEEAVGVFADISLESVARTRASSLASQKITCISAACSSRSVWTT